MTAYPARMLSPSQFRVTLLLISLLTVVPTVALANDNTVSTRGAGPSAYEFVQEWTKTYGVDHKRAAAMMTAQHRGGMSEAEWIELYGSFIEYVQYKHLGSELISAQEEEHKARVILKSSVDSIKGPVVQHEIYDLVKVDGSWLIDFIDIRDENFGTAIGPEPTKQFDSKSNKPSPRRAPSE